MVEETRSLTPADPGMPEDPNCVTASLQSEEGAEQAREVSISGAPPEPRDADPDTSVIQLSKLISAAFRESALPDMATVVLDSLARIFRARRAALIRRKGEKPVIEAARPPITARRESFIRWDIVDWTVEQSTSVVLTAGQSGPGEVLGVPCRFPESIICVPLDSGPHPETILYLTSDDPWPTLRDDAALLRIHVEILRYALEKDRLRQSVSDLESRLLRACDDGFASAPGLGYVPPASAAIPDEEARRLRGRFPGIIAHSPGMLRVLAIVEKFAPTTFPILVEGESGTGKELIARAIHRLSGRIDGPFVSENCGACPEGLLESEFFGVERGAFTGADRARPGLLELANGGTLFLDEIAEMTLALQKKLLRALQERSGRRLGAKEPVSFDFRLVSATNRTLADMVAAGTFREDLLYRLNLVTIRIPPLRERQEDIAPLVEHVLAEYARAESTSAPAVSERAMRILRRYEWPGNVRELRNEICRAAVIGVRQIEPSTLSPCVRDHVSRGNNVRRAIVQGVKSLAEIEREVIGTVIQDVIARCGGNKTLAARLLGIPKTTLYHRMFRYGLLGLLNGSGAQRAGAASGDMCT